MLNCAAGGADTGNGWGWLSEPYHVVNDGHGWEGALSFTALQLMVDRYIVRTGAEGVTTAQALKDLGLFHYCPTLDCDQLAAPLKMAPYKALLTLLPKAVSATAALPFPQAHVPSEPTRAAGRSRPKMNSVQPNALLVCSPRL